MNTFATILIGIVIMCMGRILFSLFMLMRNDWVYRQRIRLLEQDMATFKKLDTYDTMMHRWWIWDVEKFIRK